MPFFFEIIWISMVDSHRLHDISCGIPKATGTHSEYVTLIAFPLQQWLLARASLLRYAYIA